MQIVVFGIGGVGGYFGGKLAKTNHKVTFVVRGRHKKAIEEHGLKVKSIYGDFLAVPNLVTDTIKDIESPDLILICTKTWQLEEAALHLKPIIKENTIVIPLQNGANNVEKLLGILPERHVVGGLCKIISYVESPGVINHKAFHPQVVFGEIGNERTPRMLEIKKVFDEAGFDNIIADNIQLAVWKKFLFICTISGIGALTRAEMGLMRKNEVIKNLMRETANEIVALAQAKGIGLTENDIVAVFNVIEGQDPKTTSSMQRDIMEGRPSELEDFNGYVVKEAKRLNIEVPVNKLIYSLLLPQEMMARGL